MVNGQIEVHVLVQAPLILGFVVLLPEFLPMLYSEEFLPALQMTQVAMLGMMFHAMTYPISFMPLSAGDSLTFLVQESIYNIALVLLVLFGYECCGLYGLGLGMLLLRVLDFAVVSFIAIFKYGFVFSRRVLKYQLIQLLFFVVVLSVVLSVADGILMWVLGIAAVCCSALASLYVLSRHNSLFYKIFKRLLRKK